MYFVSTLEVSAEDNRGLRGYLNLPTYLVNVPPL